MSNLYRWPSKYASYQVSIHLARRFQRIRFFRNQPIRNKNCLWWPCLLTDRNEISNLYRGPSKDASYQISIHLTKRLQRRLFLNQPIRNKICLWQPCLITDRDEKSNLCRRPAIDASYQIWIGSFGQLVSEEKIFKNQPIRNKNCLWWPCLLTDRNKMSNLYRGPSKDASYQVSVHFAKRFQRRIFFRNQPIRNKNCLWWPCLLTDRNKMCNLYRGPFKDTSYQVSIHLAKRFQRRRFF
jgi:Zn-finger protein